MAGRPTGDVYIHDAIVLGGLVMTVMVMVFVSRIAHHAVLEAVSGTTDSESAG